MIELTHLSINSMGHKWMLLGVPTRQRRSEVRSISAHEVTELLLPIITSSHRTGKEKERAISEVNRTDPLREIDTHNASSSSLLKIQDFPESVERIQNRKPFAV
jgi:hypothetical protein